MGDDEEKIRLGDFTEASITIFEAVESGHPEADKLLIFLKDILERKLSGKRNLVSYEDDALNNALDIVMKGRLQLRIEPFECVDKGYTRIKVFFPGENDQTD